MKFEFSQQILKKYSNIKFHENPSSGSLTMWADGQTDILKLIVAFCNLTNAPKKLDFLQ
jgi:hypothetical protein